MLLEELHSGYGFMRQPTEALDQFHVPLVVSFFYRGSCWRVSSCSQNHVFHARRQPRKSNQTVDLYAPVVRSTWMDRHKRFPSVFFLLLPSSPLELARVERWSRVNHLYTCFPCVLDCPSSFSFELVPGLGFAPEKRATVHCWRSCG